MLISLYLYDDYRRYIRDRFAQMPKAGHGQALKMANFLDVHTTFISQVMKETKSFSLEQSAKVAEFFGLSESESDYFVALVEFDRAGSDALKKILTTRLNQHRLRETELSRRLKSEIQFDEKARARFYSDWIYSGVRQLVAIPGFDHPEAIAERLFLPLKVVNSALEFLITNGLCKEENGKIKVGPTSTHLESSSPWIGPHHRNWRQQAIEKFVDEQPAKLYYSCPMTISLKDAEKIREQIVTFLESLDPLIEKSPSEDLFCLNIDWFRI